MARRKFHVGDKVQIIGMSHPKYPLGMKDELGTEDLFKSMIGKVYTIRGFDKYGHVELCPKRWHLVWVEPRFLKLRKKKTGGL